MKAFEAYLKLVPEYDYDPEGPQPGFDLVLSCLHEASGDGCLPEPLIEQLKWNMMLLKSGRESPLFQKQGTKPGAHPKVRIIENMALMYIWLSENSGSDKSPVKTVCDVLGVSKSTVYRWKSKNTGLPSYFETHQVLNGAFGLPLFTEKDTYCKLAKLGEYYRKNKPK